MASSIHNGCHTLAVCSYAYAQSPQFAISGNNSHEATTTSMLTT